MAKTKTPFLSLGAHGSVGEAITAQKRGQETLLREKPLPTDPYSLPQAYQRWLYQDYAYLWTQQTAATKRQYSTLGSRHHLTGFQYWMKVMLSTLPDIVAWWKLDDPAGATTRDSSRYNSPCNIFGASPATGLNNGCLYFDGLNDYIAPADHGQYHFNTEFTIECLLYLNRDSVIQSIIARDDATNRSWWFIADSTNTLRLFVWKGGVWSMGESAAILLKDAWHHVCGRYDGSNVSVFIDGQKGPRNDALVGAFDDDPVQLTIGKRMAPAPYWLKGYIDNAIIIDRSLDDTEILSHSNRRYHPFIPVAPPIEIDIGAPAIVRANEWFPFATFINSSNPANADGIIDTIEIYASQNMSGVRVGLFYHVAGLDYKCRSSTTLGNVAAGAKRTFPGLSLAVEEGDFLGAYWTGGRLMHGPPIIGATYRFIGEAIDPGDQATYVLLGIDSYSLYGAGEG